jgi:glutamate dehydrogenase
MTTRSIHPYVLGVLEKLGLEESSVTKLQTGGPDGDLGSNEIKISKDKTTAIVDGSGVLYDPAGIDRTELLRLATSRKMIDNFDISRLGPQGFRVLVSEVNVRLPDGTSVPNGTNFRNNFHLSAYAAADIFVPCGGRPEAVSVSNVGQLYDVKARE